MKKSICDEKNIDMSYVSYEECLEDESGERWFFAFDINALYKINGDNEVAFVTTIKEYSFSCVGLFNVACIYKDEIVLMPRKANHIAFVNRKSGEYELLKVPSIIGSKHKFAAHYLDDDRLLLFGHLEPAVLILDIHNRSFSVIEIEVPSDVKEYAGIFRKQLYQYNKKLYVPCMFSNYIMEFDLLRDEYSFLHVGSGKSGYGGICGKEEEVWLTSLKANLLLKLDLRTFNCTEYLIPESWIEVTAFLYGDCVFYNGRVIAFPAYSNPLIIFDTITETVSRVTTEKKGESIAPYRCAYIYKNNLIVVMDNGGRHLRLRENNQLIPYTIDFDFDSLCECYLNHMEWREKVVEQPYVSLGILIDAICKE